MANTLEEIKRLSARQDVRTRFTEILGKRAPQFIASLTNAVAGNPGLQKCDPNSIMAASFVAAALDLPIDSNLGFAAIVPYKKRARDPRTGQWGDVTLAQFQVQYKGFVQLAIRSGQYQKMNYAEVYEDELVSYNPITGEMQFVEDFSKCTQRLEGKEENIVGYYAWFRLHSGFTQELYMTKQSIINHARKYSQAYRYDLEKGRQSSPWSTNFSAMAKKTVLKQLLSKWGILSVEMQQAMTDDQMVYQPDGVGTYADNEPAPIQVEAVDALADEPTSDPTAELPPAEPRNARSAKGKTDPAPRPGPVAEPPEHSSAGEDVPWTDEPPQPPRQPVQPQPRKEAQTRQPPAAKPRTMEDDFAEFDAMFSDGQDSIFSN